MSYRESIQTIQEESVEGSTICKICKKETSAADEEFNLHFQDTSMIQNPSAMGADDSAIMGDVTDKTPGGTTANSFQNNPKAFKMYK